MTKDEALKLALEALEDLGMKHFENTGEVLYKETFTAIKEALAQPEQEPVAWIYKGEKSFDGNKYSDEYELTSSKQVALWKDKNAKPLYTTPQSTWVGLTDEEIDDLSRTMVKGNKSVNWLCQAIKAKLKEKNEQQTQQ